MDNINIYFDYEEDSHYQVKIDDSFALKEDFGSKKLEDILKTYQQQDQTSTIAEYAIQGIYYFFTCNLANINHENILRFFELSGSELLMDILYSHSENSPLVAAHGCLIMIILVSSVPEMKEYFGEKGFCDLVSYILSVNIGNAEISEYGTYCIAILTKKYFQNIHRFYKSKTNLCELLSQIGYYGCNVRHQKSLMIARNVCFALGNIAEPIFTKSFKEHQVIQLLMTLFYLHSTQDGFVSSMFYVIHRILLLNPKFLEEFLSFQSYKMMDIISKMVNHYEMQVLTLFRLWQLLIRFYKISSHTKLSTNSPWNNVSNIPALLAAAAPPPSAVVAALPSPTKKLPITPMTPATPVSPPSASLTLLSLFHEQLNQFQTDFLLFSIILKLMKSIPEVEITEEYQQLQKIVTDITPNPEKNSNSGNFANTNYVSLSMKLPAANGTSDQVSERRKELFGGDALYAKIVTCIINYKQDSSSATARPSIMSVPTIPTDVTTPPPTDDTVILIRVSNSDEKK
jgi:hypothetical protein